MEFCIKKYDFYYIRNTVLRFLSLFEDGGGYGY